MNEAERAKRDAIFVAARKAVSDAIQAWRQAGGTWADPWDPWAIGPQPSQPELYNEIRSAKATRDELSRQACPQNVSAFLDGLGDGDPDAVDEAVTWLEADPFAQHTGYLKQKVMRRLARIELTEEHRKQLRRTVLALCTRGPRYEFTETRHLARRQLASPGFAAELRTIEETAPQEHARQAARLVRLSVESTL